MAADVISWIEARASRSNGARAGIGIAVAVLAYALQLALWELVPPSPFLLFYPAVFLAARLGGARAGYVATFASSAAVAYDFLPPARSLAIASTSHVVDLGIFAAVSVGISWTMGRLHDALARERAAARDAEHAQQATNDTWSMIAHDLRAPLHTITLGSEQLGRRVHDAAPELERTVAIIQRSSERARELVSDAVDAMRLAHGALELEPAPHRAYDVVADVIEGLRVQAESREVSLELRADEPARAADVRCDRRRIVQVLTNLVGNAVKFTPRGGHVAVGLALDGDAVRVSVADDGPGIPAEHLADVFERYWTRDRTGGHGLGLWIAKTIVEAHGAALGVESACPGGTTFTFALPRAVSAPAAREGRASSRAS